MLNIKSLEFANFLSYGDYVTFINLDNIGVTLITGSNDDDRSMSNGVGKTSITTAIIWCLFGRTQSRHNPGDNVINYNTGKSCYVKITTLDGYEVTRTRKVNNHDDLLILKDGIDISLSTNKNAQQLLNTLFNLNYDIFTTSMFFGQNTDSFISMSDIKRRNVLERLLGINKFNLYADCAKETKNTILNEQQSFRLLLKSKESDLQKEKLDKDVAISKSSKFEIDRQTFINDLNRKINDASERLNAFEIDNSLDNDIQSSNDTISKISLLNERILNLNDNRHKYELLITNCLANIDINKKIIDGQTLIDVDKIIKQEYEYDIAIATKREIESNIVRIKSEISVIDAKILDIDQKISNINTLNGTVCRECLQMVDDAHSGNILTSLSNELQKYFDDKSKYNHIVIKLSDKNNLIHVTKPSISSSEAIRINKMLSECQLIVDKSTSEMNEYNGHVTKIDEQIGKCRHFIKQLTTKIEHLNLNDRIKKRDILNSEMNTINIDIKILNDGLRHEKSKINPYIEIIRNIECKIVSLENEIVTLNGKICTMDIKINMYEYIRKSYSDKNKIKMFVLSELIPYFNDRIQYYINAFECDVDIKFTSSLNIETSKWDYDFYSGGQQKRIDLSIMFALYDLYIYMYGKQCNVMVLDEIDGSLDMNGVKMFVDVINNDFSGSRDDKPSTILIISHKNEMIDQFPGKINVTRDVNGFSHTV
jgi:DNA repair exonuclease SbcCD ATPase subunit